MQLHSPLLDGLCNAPMGFSLSSPFLCVLQIVSSKTITRPLQLKKGKPAGKGTITVCTVCVLL